MKPMRIVKMIGSRTAGIVAMGLSMVMTPRCFAGHTLKWEEAPEAVRAMVLANGGQAGPVDRESGRIDGKVVYEAVGKDKAGKPVDLVVAEDGKLVMTKDDDAADKAEEQGA